MKLILHYLKRYKKLLIINVISVSGFALVELGIPTIIADIIDVGIVNTDTDYIVRMGFVVLLTSLISINMTILLGYCCAKTSTAVTRDIRNDIFGHTQRFTAYEFNRFEISSMITRTNNDAFQIQMSVNALLRTVLMTPVILVASIIMTARASLPLSDIIVAVILLIIIGVFVVAKISKPISEGQQTSLDSLNRTSREDLSGIHMIRALDDDAYEQQHFDDTSEKFAGYSKELFKLMMMASPTFFLLVNIADLCIYWVAALLIQGDDLSLGQLVAFMDYLFHVMLPIMLSCTVFMIYPYAEVSTERIEAVFDTVPLVHNDGRRMDGNQQGTISFEHMTFVYSDGKESVLKDVSFSAEKGETITFIGSTGSGRNTLVNLTLRFYDVSERGIRVDGADVHDYDLFGLYFRLGVIPQRALLFSGTIADNIHFGEPGVTVEEATQAAKTAQAYDFIMEKEHGSEEEVTEGATNVSGGQEQRLSTAWALVRKPDIYVFDNSFSTLNFRTDTTLRKKLKKETGDTIVMVVARRIPSIMGTDLIVVLNERNVIDTGTHRELLRNCEIYKEIALSQLSEEELAHK